jgi:hypothetical protein
MPLQPGGKLGPYEILASISKGGIGESGAYRHGRRLLELASRKIETVHFSHWRNPMKIRRSGMRQSVSAPVLAVGLVLCFAYLAPANRLWSASAQVTSPNGSYGIIVNQWKDLSSNNISALLGVLNFDGAGNINGTYTLFSTKNGKAGGTWTGTYTGNPGGSNTISLTLDVGGTITAAVAVTDGGTGLQILVTGGSLPKPGQVLTGTGRIQSAQGTMPAGSYGFLLNQWPDASSNPDGFFGVINLDGAGTATGSYTFVGSDIGPAPISGTFMGTYSVNPDSTGSMVLTFDVGFTATLAIVVVDGGSGILILQVSATGGAGGSVISGTARMQ